MLLGEDEVTTTTTTPGDTRPSSETNSLVQSCSSALSGVDDKKLDEILGMYGTEGANPKLLLDPTPPWPIHSILWVQGWGGGSNKSSGSDSYSVTELNGYVSWKIT